MSERQRVKRNYISTLQRYECAKEWNDWMNKRKMLKKAYNER
jgi:hypothetical protein